ncbi:transcription factor STE12 [Paramuricea clavata]|uniref:Transcription factor STE12 n=1 Tax=Paramuricea clavata TaxID=317549 RepID=A0A7D9LPN9_PARCT|nr:transcription factor STE12 [Paramuricea clavata]CAB4034897.1 transcription factor STE12 [Paramuricea clavata]
MSIGKLLKFIFLVELTFIGCWKIKFFEGKHGIATSGKYLDRTFMSELENDEINRQLCAVDTFSWSPETQEEILAEGNNWQHDEPASTEPSLCCDECGRVFARSDNLNRHMKSHSDKNHECSRCRKKFNRKDALNRHMKTHSDKD